MMEEIRNGTMTEEQFHKKMAVDLFNRTWDLLDKPERTPEENDELVHAGHASRYHWSKVGTPLELARGEQQLSHIYAVLKRAEPALYHGQRALEICRANDIADFDIAFAYEALARANAVAGNRPERDRYVELARAAADGIAKEDDRKYFLSQLETV
jgi:hypothetical protein